MKSWKMEKGRCIRDKKKKKKRISRCKLRITRKGQNCEMSTQLRESQSVLSLYLTFWFFSCNSEFTFLWWKTTNRIVRCKLRIAKTKKKSQITILTFSHNFEFIPHKFELRYKILELEDINLQLREEKSELHDVIYFLFGGGNKKEFQDCKLRITRNSQNCEKVSHNSEFISLFIFFIFFS